MKSANWWTNVSLKGAKRLTKSEIAVNVKNRKKILFKLTLN